MRAEATLAAANGAFLALLLTGGMVLPLDALPGWLGALAGLLPAAALAQTLRAALEPAAPFPIAGASVLLAWALAAPLIAARTFRWE